MLTTLPVPSNRSFSCLIWPFFSSASTFSWLLHLLGGHRPIGCRVTAEQIHKFRHRVSPLRPELWPSSIRRMRKLKPDTTKLILFLPADVTEHVRMDVQTDVGHVVEMLAGDQPDDFADLAFGIIAGHAGKSLRVGLLVSGQLGYIVQCCALSIDKKSARAVLLQRIEFGFIHRRFDRERSTDVDAEKTDVDTRHLFTNEQGGLCRQHQLFIQLADLRIEQTERER